MSVHDQCNKDIIQLNSKWLPRALNGSADTLSRMSDCDDWEIKQVVFDYFDKAWGKHTCDRFASKYNSTCERFNSKYWCSGSSGVDAFEQDWSNCVN